MDCKITKSYIALGTNLGNKTENLQAGLEKLVGYETSVLKESSLYTTKPWGGVEQDDFLNQVVLVETALEPLELLKALKSIEGEVGRTETVRWGPRVLDMDILTYGDEVVDLENLQIPHPQIANRSFVLVPLLELDENIEILGERASAMLKKLPLADQEISKL